MEGDSAETSLDPAVIEQVEIQTKYSGYIQKQLQEIERLSKLDQRVIPADVDFHSIRGLATEARQKLSAVRPHTVGQASRVPGVTPPDISILLVYLEQRKGRAANG